MAIQQPGPAKDAVASQSPLFARRDPALDVARGLIVAVMALDHVRIFFTSASFDPLDLTLSTPGYFLTRWVTHFCAPGFFFIAGIAAGLFERASGRAQASRFLVARGLFLMAAEVLIFGLAWSFTPGWWWFGVIWALGAAMVILAGLLWIDKRLLLLAALAFVGSNNILWGGGPPGPGLLRHLLLTGGMVELGHMGEHLVIYSLLPWTAIMVVGYASTGWLESQGHLRPKPLLVAGAVALVLFVLARSAGVGQPMFGGVEWNSDWRVRALSFLNVEKYPPSLQFQLLTIGIMLLVLGALERHPDAAIAAKPFLAFGRVPFFFYLIHLFLIHSLALVAAAALGWPTGHLFWKGSGPDLIPPAGYGVGLAGVYTIWLVVLALLYPASRWMGRLKQRSASSLLRLL